MVVVAVVLRLEVLMAQFLLFLLFAVFSEFGFWRVWPFPKWREEKTDKHRRADKLALFHFSFSNF